ncbi:hypothetical protein BHM03_00013775, partial [Ensete ventricosum]
QPPCQGATTPVTGGSPLRVPCSRPPYGRRAANSCHPCGLGATRRARKRRPCVLLSLQVGPKRERGVFCCYFRLTCSSPNPILSGFPSLRHMASLDTDVDMVPAEEDSSVAQAPSSSSVPASSSSKKPKRFDIKKWNAVSLWAWGTCLTRTPS